MNADAGLTFRFRRNAKIGKAAVEEDDDFLFQSFFDFGDFNELKNTRSPRRKKKCCGIVGKAKRLINTWSACNGDAARLNYNRLDKWASVHPVN